MIRILLIDNYDSFTYNSVHAYQSLGVEVQVVRNNAISMAQIRKIAPHLLVIGPGPGNPKNAGISKECVQSGLSVFGICLGHQTIAEVFGASIVRASYAMHGKISAIYHNRMGVFAHLPQGFAAVRYHSLIIDPKSLPPTLEITAWTADGEIMGIRHKELPIQGVQFHPESTASHYGYEIS